MVQVQCKKCGAIRYTAYPQSAVCACGGKFKVTDVNQVDAESPQEKKYEHFVDSLEYPKES